MLVLLLAMLAAGGAYPERAAAAPCGAPFVTNGADLQIEGAFPNDCGEQSENFSVFCDAGTVKFDYYVNSTFVGTTTTATGCATPTRITVNGYIGGDRIDLSRVSAPNGFTGINQPNVLSGSFGNDVLIGSAFPDSFQGSLDSDFAFARDGRGDTVDCGAEFDFAQLDQQGTDSPIGCEFTDFLPAPAAATPAAAPPRTQVKCKKKRRSALAAKKKRCKKRRRSAR